jgi:hypothetical protein
MRKIVNFASFSAIAVILMTSCNKQSTSPTPDTKTGGHTLVRSSLARNYQTSSHCYDENIVHGDPCSQSGTGCLDEVKVTAPKKKFDDMVAVINTGNTTTIHDYFSANATDLYSFFNSGYVDDVANNVLTVTIHQQSSMPDYYYFKFTDASGVDVAPILYQ